MKLFIALVLSALIFWTLPNTKSPVNNSEPRQVQAIKAEKPLETSEKTDVKAITAEKQEVPKVEVQPEPVPVAIQVPELSVPSSNEEMMAAAGISPKDYGAVDYIVHHESTWNTKAINASSGSCGLVQELPCGKSGCTLGDGVCQLRWATDYATSRYGSWWGAYAFWQSNHWW